MPRWLGLLLRLLGTAAGLVWIAFQVDANEAATAIGKLSLVAVAAAAVLVAANVVAGAVRWRVLMRAYGAVRIPPLGECVRLYLIAFFYNNYLPGAVAGDVGRGVVARDAFGDQGATGALAVVFVERLLGLFGLFALLALGLVVTRGVVDSGTLWWWTAIGGTGACALVAAIPVARRLAPHLPGPLARIAAKLPELADRRAFAGAIALSVATQALVAVAGWLLLAQLGSIGFGASLLVVPLAAATTFLPITVGGTGAREAAYVALCGSLFGMPEPDALAASLGLWFAHLAVGAVGGVVQLAARQRRP